MAIHKFNSPEHSDIDFNDFESNDVLAFDSGTFAARKIHEVYGPLSVIQSLYFDGDTLSGASNETVAGNTLTATSLAGSITPTSASSLILLDVHGQFRITHDGTGSTHQQRDAKLEIYQDTTAGAGDAVVDGTLIFSLDIGRRSTQSGGANTWSYETPYWRFLLPASSTSEREYRLCMRVTTALTNTNIVYYGIANRNPYMLIQELVPF